MSCNNAHTFTSLKVALAQLWYLVGFGAQISHAFLFFPRGASIGYIAALAQPLDLGANRNVYMAFNFEANWGLPSNDSYNEWIDRWNLSESFTGIGNNITAINNRRRRRSRRVLRYTRTTFYSSLVGYLEHFQMNGTACLLRTICEVSESSLDENNGLLGSIFKILFMPTTSEHEQELELGTLSTAIYVSELQGSRDNCAQYTEWCPEGVLGLISTVI